LRSLAAALSACAAVAVASPSLAGQQFGGCVERLHLCLGASAALHLLQWNLTTNRLSAGIVPGAGYGATWSPEEWYAAGLHLYLSSVVGGGRPANLTPSLVASFANYVRVGVGASIDVEGRPSKPEWILLFGLGSDFAGSPRYVRERVREAGNS
jgi:hypothetical protein